MRETQRKLKTSLDALSIFRDDKIINIVFFPSQINNIFEMGKNHLNRETVTDTATLSPTFSHWSKLLTDYDQ